jgi:hypothetical protein
MPYELKIHYCPIYITRHHYVHRLAKNAGGHLDHKIAHKLLKIEVN